LPGEPRAAQLRAYDAVQGAAIRLRHTPAAAACARGTPKSGTAGPDPGAAKHVSVGISLMEMGRTAKPRSGWRAAEAVSDSKAEWEGRPPGGQKPRGRRACSLGPRPDSIYSGGTVKLAHTTGERGRWGGKGRGSPVAGNAVVTEYRRAAHPPGAAADLRYSPSRAIRWLTREFGRGANRRAPGPAAPRCPALRQGLLLDP